MKEFEEFVKKYTLLNETEKFALSAKFKDLTGGKLSPYNNPVPVVVALIEIEDEFGKNKLLGIRRGIQPNIGGLALVGGYVDEGENLEFAVSREVEEEVGLTTDPSQYKIIDSKINKANNLLIFLKYKNVLSYKILKECKLSSEVKSLELIDEESILCFPFHQEKIDDFFKNRNIKKLKY